MMIKISLVHGDITKLNIEAIVNPANSYITMGGGLAGAIRRAGGDVIRKEAQKHVPVPIGKAVVTVGGNLPCRFVIHAPTMELPAQRTNIENVRKAVNAALACAEEHGIREIAISGLGTGVGGVDYGEAAKTIIEAIKNFKGTKLKRVVLIDIENKMYESFQMFLNKKQKQASVK